MGWCSSSCVVRCLLTSSPQELLGQSLSNLACSISRVRKQEIVNFMIPHPTPRGDNFGVKLMYFSKIFFSTPGHRSVRMTKKGSTEIVNLITPEVGVPVLGCGQISHIVFKSSSLLLDIHVDQTN